MCVCLCARAACVCVFIKEHCSTGSKRTNIETGGLDKRYTHTNNIRVIMDGHIGDTESRTHHQIAPPIIRNYSESI